MRGYRYEGGITFSLVPRDITIKSRASNHENMNAIYYSYSISLSHGAPLRHAIYLPPLGLFFASIIALGIIGVLEFESLICFL